MSYLINVTKDASLVHKHRNYEIIVYMENNGCFCTPDKKTRVSKGNIIIVPPDTLHGSLMNSGIERIYISGEFSQIFNFTEPVIVSDNDNNDGLTLAKIIYNNRFENPDYVASLCNAFAHFLLCNINMDDNISVAIKEIIHEITENFHNPDIVLCHILNKSGYAEDYIRSCFKKMTGKTPTEFLTEIRVSHARYLIDVYTSGLSLSDIAEKCGYDDYIYFSRRFKQITGVSPRSYKKNLTNKKA